MGMGGERGAGWVGPPVGWLSCVDTAGDRFPLFFFAKFRRENFNPKIDTQEEVGLPDPPHV